MDKEEGSSQGYYNLIRPIHNGVVSPKVHYKTVKTDLRGTSVKSLASFVNLPILIGIHASVAELADANALGAFGVIRVGSSPIIRTILWFILTITK